MQELARYQPDLFVVLAGHNEFMEERSYRALRDRSRLREALDFVVARSRTGAMANRLIDRRLSRPPSRLAIAETTARPRTSHGSQSLATARSRVKPSPTSEEPR